MGGNLMPKPTKDRIETLRLILQAPYLKPYWEEIDALCDVALHSLAAMEGEGVEDAYIPGYLMCTKCAFGGLFSILYTQSGNVGPQDVTEREVCPNDGSDLRRVTWRERANDYAKMCESQGDTIKAQLEAAERTGRILAKQAEQLKRIPDCPPCDMGENTECICKEPLTPLKWMNETIVERDAALALVKELREGLEVFVLPMGECSEEEACQRLSEATENARALLLRAKGVK